MNAGLLIPTRNESRKRSLQIQTGDGVTHALRPRPPTHSRWGFVMSFAQTPGTQLVLDDRPFHFAGANTYYLSYKSNVMVDAALDAGLVAT